MLCEKLGVSDLPNLTQPLFLVKNRPDLITTARNQGRQPAVQRQTLAWSGALATLCGSLMGWDVLGYHKVVHRM